MSLNVYLDDCAYAKQLVVLLRAAGHRVVTPADAGTTGTADPVHFQYAATNGLVLLTKNPTDFEDLHRANPAHHGILAVYQDNDPGRDMNYAEVVRAIANLEAAGVAVVGQFHVLNAWRY